MCEIHVRAEKEKKLKSIYCILGGFPSGASSQEPACQCRRLKRHGFDPWVGKIPLEEGMATHFSFLARRIPWTEEPGRLWSIGLHRVGYD